MELADLTRVIAPTLSRQLFMMAKQLDDVVDFTLGDPDIPTPLPICEAAAKTARAGYPRCALNVENIFPRGNFYPSVNTFTKLVPYVPMPKSEDIASRILCLPLHVRMTMQDLEAVSDIVLSNL